MLPVALGWLVLCASVGFPAAGQAPRGYTVLHLTDENGLPQNSVKGLAIGDAGFLWIATEAGLARYDGQRVRVYSKELLKTQSDRLFGFARCPFDGSLVAIAEHDEFLRVTRGSAFLDSTYRSHPHRIRRLSSDNRAIFLPVSPNQYYVYVPGKVALVRQDQIVFQAPFKGTPYFQKFPSELNMRNRIIRETKDSVCADNFFSIGGRLYYHISSEGPAVLQISQHARNTQMLKGDIVRDSLYSRQKQRIRLYQNRVHGQVFACLGKNIYQVLASGKAGELTTRLRAGEFDIEETFVSQMLYDENSRTLFLGSFSKGLFVLRHTDFQTILDKKEKDFHNVFYAQVPLDVPGVAIAEGLALKENAAGKAESGRLWTSADAGRFNMVRDRSGLFWIRDGDDIVRIHGENGRKEVMASFPDPPPSLYQGYEEGVWLGFRSGTVMYLPPEQGARTDSLFSTGAQVTFQYQDIPGRHWIGTNNGLFVASLARRKLAFVGLAGKTIRGLYASAPGELWIMTYGDGMYLFKRGYLRKIQSDAEGFLHYPHCIGEDRNGDFWISCNKGLFRARKSDLLAYAEGKTSSVFYVYYNRDNGLITNEFNGGCQPCMARLSDGRFSFPTINGLVWFHPEQVPMPGLHATFVLDEMRVDGEVTSEKGLTDLSPDYQYVHIQLTSPLFHNNENLDFHYRIQPAGDASPGKWVKAEKDQSFRFYRLSPGDYILTIRKTTGFQGKYLEKKVFLHIRKPWYLMAWFWIPALVAAVLLVRAYTHGRLLWLKRQNDALRERVEQRTLHLSRALEDVRRSDAALQTQLQIQLRIISALNHDLLTPLRFLNRSIPYFVEKVAGELPDSPTTQIGERLRQSTEKVVNFADNLLKFTKATYLQNDRLLSEKVDVGAILSSKASFFEEIAQENKIRLDVRTSGRVVIPTSEQMLEIVVHNLIDNTLKHTYDGTVTLHAAEAENGNVVVTVADTGDGMPDEIVEWLNHSPADTETPVPRVPANLGMGLIIVKEITELLHVRLRVETSSDGTLFTLRIARPQ